MSAILGRAKLGAMILGDGATAAPLPPRAWATDATPDARVMAAHAARRDRAWLVAEGRRGDVERPDAIDQLPVTKSPWDVAMGQPVPVPTDRQSNWHSWQWFAYGEPPRAEIIDSSKYVFELRQPVPVPRALPPTDWFVTDGSHLGDAENVFGPAFSVGMDQVRRGRPSPLRVPDTAITEPSLIPEDPVTQFAPWHVEMTRRPPERRPSHLLPGGVWLASEQFAPESPQADKFSVPMSQPDRPAHLRKDFRPGFMEGLDLSEDEQPEVVRLEAFRPMGLPGSRAPVAQLPGVLVIVPDFTAEAVHADALARDDQPVGMFVRRQNAAAHEAARTEVIIAENFGQPNIAILHKYQLSGGLWRGRM